MGLVVTVSGSPSAQSRSSLLARQVAAKLEAERYAVESINVRDLPADDLLHANLESPPLREALGLIERADGIVITTPIYKASFTGVLKTFLDLLPQFGLTGKVVLPLATGGTVAHVLAIDYALRPVLSSLNALHIVAGLFLLDTQLERSDGGGLSIEAGSAKRLDAIVEDFIRGIRRMRAS
jgi:FMN reductase